MGTVAANTTSKRKENRLPLEREAIQEQKGAVMTLNQIVPDRSGFTASNGLKVFPSPGPNGRSMRVEYPTYPDDPDATRFVAGFAAEAIREYVRAEEDERLGRWRWPENPDFVVRERHAYAAAVVMNEATGDVVLYYRDDLPKYPLEATFAGAAAAFFDAHPEPKPAWHDAKPGEVWLVRVDGVDIATVVNTEAGFARFIDGEGTDYGVGYIESGRRIWPEDAS